MIKIQGTCKFKGIEEDHFFEFVLPLNNIDNPIFLNQKQTNFLKLNDNIYINDFKKVFMGDITAIQTRIHAFDEEEKDSELQHKFYNHIGRFHYLIKFLIKCVYTENKLDLSKKEISNLSSFSLKIFVLFYLLKISNQLYLLDYSHKLKDKEIINDFLKDYYTILKERKEIKEHEGALSIEGRTFKKSQINGLEVNSKKKTEKSEPYVLWRNIYNELFPSEGGKRKTRKIRN